MGDSTAVQADSGVGESKMGTGTPVETIETEAETDVGAAFLALPFDEQLMETGSELVTSSASSTLTTMASSSASGGANAPFFLDTAAIAQQIAASVSDDKSLPGNIMDLIPPPQVIPAAESAVTDAALLQTPLAPPANLMSMRALSPPMSLLPELSASAAMPALSLVDTSTALSAAAATLTAASLATMPPTIPANTPSSTSSFATTGGLKKRKSSEAFGEASVTGAPPIVKTESPPISAASAAVLRTPNLQALAREKVMKEPQSGELYECVITKRNGGLGLTLACVDDHVQITGLAPDTPASESGICVGDTLVAVSGLPVRGLQFSTVIGRLKSSSRTSVRLQLRRNPFRHNSNGGALPYRSSNGSGTSPARAARALSESNAAKLLSASKSIALETRLAGLAGGAGMSADAASNILLDCKTDPSSSTHMKPDASIQSSTPEVDAWHEAQHDRDRYFAECRRLRLQLAQSYRWRRRERASATRYEHHVQHIAQRFDEATKHLQEGVGDAKTTDADGSEQALRMLRQQLLDAKRSLAQQQTEMMELRSRDSRHAIHEVRRVRNEIVAEIQKRMRDLVVAMQSNASCRELLRSCEQRVEGVRPSVFDMLFQPHKDPSGVSELPTSPKMTTLDLDATHSAQALQWNLREQGPRGRVVQIASNLRVEYAQSQEVITLRYDLRLTQDLSPSS